MKYGLIKSTHFSRKATKLLNSNPELIQTLKRVLIQLSEDPYSPTLKSHKLKGQLMGSLACSLNYEYRIIFKIIENYKDEQIDTNVILLETIGTHDEVY